MPRIFLVSNANIKQIYSVDQAVGPGCANRREDVLLVQLFLSAAMESHNGKSFRPPGQQPIKIDGSFGRQTQAYIKFFEEESNRQFPQHLLSTDGRIDPVPPNSGGMGSVSGKEYKIVALNTVYRNRRGPAMHSDIRLDPLYPAALNQSLYV